jgi:hypothetical protein
MQHARSHRENNCGNIEFQTAEHRPGITLSFLSGVLLGMSDAIDTLIRYDIERMYLISKLI